MSLFPCIVCRICYSIGMSNTQTTFEALVNFDGRDRQLDALRAAVHYFDMAEYVQLVRVSLSILSIRGETILRPVPR